MLCQEQLSVGGVKRAPLHSPFTNTFPPTGLEHHNFHSRHRNIANMAPGGPPGAGRGRGGKFKKFTRGGIFMNFTQFWRGTDTIRWQALLQEPSTP